VELSHVGKMALSVELAQHAIIAAMKRGLIWELNAVAINGQMEHYVVWGQLAISVKIQRLIGLVN